MIVRDARIVEATEPELFKVYLELGFDDLMSFHEYMKRCRELGTKITEEGPESTNFAKR